MDFESINISKSIVVFLFGLIFGAFLPVCVAYLIYFVRKRKRLNKKILFSFLKQLVLMLIIFMALSLLSIFAGVYETGLSQSAEDSSRLINGIGGIIGFAGAVVIFDYGFRKGRRKKLEEQLNSSQSSDSFN